MEIKKTIKELLRDPLPDGYYIKHFISGLIPTMIFLVLYYLENNSLNLNVTIFLIGLSFCYPFSRYGFDKIITFFKKDNQKIVNKSSLFFQFLTVLFSWVFCFLIGPLGTLLAILDNNARRKLRK